MFELIQLLMMTEWDYDSTSGYYYNQSNGLHYDPNSGFYYSDAIGKGMDNGNSTVFSGSP